MDELEELRSELAALRGRVAALEATLGAAAAAAPFAPLRSTGKPAATAAPGPALDAERSLESKIGSQLFNRVGIIAVLIATAWFLKLAIDRGYLGPLARVLSGTVAGLVLIAGSERFRHRGFAAFSYSLKAIGGGVLFLSIWAAYALFDLLSLFSAGLAMVIVSVGLGVLAWFQDSELLLAYALLGGFLSPVLLSNGRNHEASLFSYLLLMDLAALVLVAQKPWPRLAPALLLGTGAYALGWYLRWYSQDQFAPTLLFASITFALFALAPLFVRSRSEAVRVWVPMLAATGAFITILLLFHGAGRAAMDLLLALVYYGLARLPEPHLPRPDSAERNWSEAGRPDRQLATLHGVLANSFLLTGVCFAIHRAWQGARPGGAIGLGEQTSYSVALMLFGSALLALGFWRARTVLRWQGLVLLCVAAGKVFLVDMGRLAESYRVLSFLGLGLLLLGISFIYQRDLLRLRG